MGPQPAVEIDAWLRDGGLLVTASERAARALAAEFHRARRAEGLTAWPAPCIQHWNRFVRTAWEERTLAREDGRLLLNPTQERAIWADIAGKGRHLATLLEGPRNRLAALAMEAHELLCSHAPSFLRDAARSSWQQDAGAFSGWLTAFDEACRTGSLLSPARLPLELIALLEADSAPRPPLLLAGFDRILPVQGSVFDAWGPWSEAPLGSPATTPAFYAADSAQAELAACALWANRHLAANPLARLLVVTQDARVNRGEIERAFLKHVQPSFGGHLGSPLFEFSLGVPLSQVPLPRAALLLLRWLASPLPEHELDWLLSTNYAAAALDESASLQSHMRSLRRASLQQPSWTLAAFLPRQNSTSRHALDFPKTWASRMTEAQRRLANLARQVQTALDWAELVPQLLQDTAFPGARPLSSPEHQALRRWQAAVETAGSLGFDGRRMEWKDFLSVLSRTLDETLFAPESRDAPIQIAGPAESAGLAADAIWLLGASEDAWPASGTTHPLLPPEVQRHAAMPHATAQADWDLALAVTRRLLASAPEVTFSYARQNKDAEARPSRLIAQIAGPPALLPDGLKSQPTPPPLASLFEDFSRIPFPPGKVEGGSGVLTAQSQCPFKAFATARLAAQSWDRAEAGLTPSQRGQLLHKVLQAVWAGSPDGIRTHSQIPGLIRREGAIESLVESVLDSEIGPALRDRMPARYLELEAERLTRLIVAWLEFEATRVDFEVAETEATRAIHIQGLTFSVRPDRIDRLIDGTLLVIDYKSGDVSPKTWDLPRPDDVQLPLYAGFALNPETEAPGGLVFAKVRAGDHSFAGRVGLAKTTLLPTLSGGNGLVKTPLTAELLIDWRDCIQQLAKDFLAGHAEVDPREYPKTCECCSLPTLCRVHENLGPAQSDDDADSQEGESDA